MEKLPYGVSLIGTVFINRDVFKDCIDEKVLVSDFYLDDDCSRLSVENFEGGYGVSIYSEVSGNGPHRATITDYGRKLTAAFTYNDSDRMKLHRKSCRTLMHLHSLTDAQCKAFIDDHNGLKENKKSKKKKEVFTS